MNVSFKRLLAILAIAVSSAILVVPIQADPLPGRDLLKFEQKPMIATTIVDTTGVPIGTYAGHDEISTAYGFPNAAGVITDYVGPFMADDFADQLSSPVVHVKWWGSYHNNITPTPQPPVQRFLIAFESDIPSPPPPQTGFSMPGQVLQLDVVNRVPALGGPGLGQFTEKLVGGPDIFGDLIYEYNAELHFNRAFPEQKDTVYWLKISALVDLPVGTQPFPPNNPPPGVTQWGWHNRDYTIKNSLASNNVTTFPFGENNVGSIGTSNIYHFQDDAVQGNLRWTQGAGLPNFGVLQTNMQPQNYVGLADGPMTGQIPGTIGIENYSKDLAFALYAVVPEPASSLLLISCALGAVVLRRRAG